MQRRYQAVLSSASLSQTTLMGTTNPIEFHFKVSSHATTTIHSKEKRFCEYSQKKQKKNFNFPHETKDKDPVVGASISFAHRREIVVSSTFRYHS